MSFSFVYSFVILFDSIDAHLRFRKECLAYDLDPDLCTFFLNSKHVHFKPSLMSRHAGTRNKNGYDKGEPQANKFENKENAQENQKLKGFEKCKQPLKWWIHADAQRTRKIARYCISIALWFEATNNNSGRYFDTFEHSQQSKKYRWTATITTTTTQMENNKNK